MQSDPIPELLVVGGIQRGGTTMLNRFLRTHPHIKLHSYEFRSLHLANHPTYMHLIAISRLALRHVFRRYKLGPLKQTYHYARALTKETSIFDFATLSDIHRANVRMMADESTRYVGEKYPSYLLNYPTYIHRKNTRCVFIYRDARDVIASNWDRVKHDWWRNYSWIKQFNSIEKLCQYWLHAMACIRDLQTLHANAHIIRYEEFVTTPQHVATALGKYLEIDGGLFDTNMPNANSIGRHKERLTQEELTTIEHLTGDVLREFNYVTRD